MSKIKTIEEYVQELVCENKDCVTCKRDQIINAMTELVDSCPEDFINHGLPASEIVKQWRKQVKGE